jgi:hypothetical protein
MAVDRRSILWSGQACCKRASPAEALLIAYNPRVPVTSGAPIIGWAYEWHWRLCSFPPSDREVDRIPDSHASVLLDAGFLEHRGYTSCSQKTGGVTSSGLSRKVICCRGWWIMYELVAQIEAYCVLIRGM